MFRHILWGLFCLSIAWPATAEIEFVVTKGPAWEAETLRKIQWIHSKLPAAWPKPDNFKVAFVESRDPSYYPFFRWMTDQNEEVVAERLLIVNDDSLSVFVHEYSHVLFDEIMRQRSKPWQHSIIWQRYKYADLEAMKANYLQEIPALQKLQKKFKDKKAAGEKSPIIESAIQNTSKSIKKYGEALLDIEKALALQDQVPHSLTEFQPFKALQAFNELFADTVACLVLEDWEAMSRVVQEAVDTPETLAKLILPPLENSDLAKQRYVEYREFSPLWTLESYVFEDWELRNVYWQLSPVRGHLRRAFDRGEIARPDVLASLINSIQKVYEKDWLPNPTQVDQSLFQKNHQMIETLRSHGLE